jgi:hypothetical protein
LNLARIGPVLVCIFDPLSWLKSAATHDFPFEAPLDVPGYV